MYVGTFSNIILVILTVPSFMAIFKTLSFPPKHSEPLFLSSMLSPKENPFPREYFPLLSINNYKIL